MFNEALEFSKIKEMLSALTLCDAAKKRAIALEPMLNIDMCLEALRETSDARIMLEAQGQPPLAIMEGLSDTITGASRGELLTPKQLTDVSTFVNTCGRMASYLKKCEVLRVELSLNSRAFTALEEIQYDIDESIRGDMVSDSASNALRDVRRRIEACSEQVKQKLNHMLRAHPEWYSGAYLSMRAGRYTLPVLAQYRSQVDGTIMDRSQTGSTLFIEPTLSRALSEKLDALLLEEDNEIRRILYALSAMVGDAADDLRQNMRLMERLDFAFAKGKLSFDMRAVRPELNDGREIVIISGRHPLLDQEKAVPLNFKLADGLRGVIITGPNTGGKTVTLKTVGLFSLMAQSGLDIPAKEGSTFCMRNLVLCDIGDGQSISENLSTFSAHMTRVLDVLKNATRDSLVLLDELGSGTDPAEGMGLAVAILDELRARQCLFAVTTHYPEIKEYARSSEGCQNARMAFDPVTLKPLYLLEAGEAGESCAIHIARRLGFPEALLKRAQEAAYDGKITVEQAVQTMRGIASPSITAFEKPKTAPQKALSYKRGDSVRVFPEGIIGIVCEETDVLGDICVQLRGNKKKISYKRIKLIAPADEMYPPDYDFSVVFDTVANRKARHVQERKHDPNSVVIVNDAK